MAAIKQTNSKKFTIEGSKFHVALHKVLLHKKFGEPDDMIATLSFVTLHGKTDTNAFPFKLQNRLLSVYIRLNGSWKRLNGLLIRLKKFASV